MRVRNGTELCLDAVRPGYHRIPAEAVSQHDCE